MLYTHIFNVANNLIKSDGDVIALEQIQITMNQNTAQEKRIGAAATTMTAK